MRELRLVATKIECTQAKEFKRLNSEMRVVWVPLDEWLTRPVGSPDPAGLEAEIPNDSEGVL